MHPKSALTSLLLVAAVQGHAQSLGAVQGAVIIGRPLDIVVQSPGATGDDSGAQCVQADVRYGEMRLSPSDVSVTVERDAAQATGVLRVRTRLPVNEPFVTLELRVGCPMRLTRAYMLLADVEPVRPAPPSAVAAPVRAPSAAPAPADRPSAAVVSPANPVAPVARQSAPETPIRPLTTAPRPAGVARLASKAKPVAAAAPAVREARGQARPAPPVPASPAGPRLELEPVDIAQAPGTKAGGDPAGVPAAAPADATAPAAEPNPAVQQELASLRAEQQRLLLAVESLNRELTAARNTRGDGILYALAGVIVVLLGALLWLLRRRPAPVAPVPSAPWWAAPAQRGAGADAPPAPVPTPAAEAMAPIQSATAGDVTAATTGSSAPRLGDHMAGLEVSEAGASVFQEVPIALLDVAALHELWERVDFFESLGQAADAVAALRAFVLAHPRASEAPYLRWWALARKHGLDTRSPQAMYEQHYQRLLAVAESADGVEADPGLVRALTRGWPGDAARAMLESALASQPGDPSAPLQVRTLAAFDDLIVLHGVLDLLPVLAQAPQAPSAAPADSPAAAADGVASALDFELPDITDLPPAPTMTPTPAPLAAGAAPSDGALDFNWSGWQPPASSAPPPR
ncbi:FimV family protein [Tepidimonas sp.]|uniref:type IV pilus assembly protein FimV n=1 Tax=Tepidimonas sp. TaxID=2002775 RepID=UPI0039196724